MGAVRVVLPAELSPAPREFWMLVRRLPAQQAKAVALVDVEGRSFREVAGLSGVARAR